MLCMLLSLELKVRRIHFCFKLVEINNINLKYFDAIVRNILIGKLVWQIKGMPLEALQ
jgi:hypothetical protein